MRRKLIQVMTVGLVVVALGAVTAGPVAAEKAKKKAPTIAKVVASSDDFSTLLTALETADLVDVFADKKARYTVFAPTNDAFAAVPAADLQALLDDPEALADVLKYHVVEGKVPSSKLEPSQEVATLQGDDILIEVGDAATITDGQGRVVTIVQTDIKARNGVIHVIDAVLLPPQS